MILSASNNLTNNKAAVDTLNVFPVPDGDTGTNMSLTLSAAAREVQSFVTSSIGEVAKMLATASLRGARGNSGVILSQFCRGMANALRDKQTATAKELAEAAQAGVTTAYKAVMRPTEGTILTVARKGAEAAVSAAQTDDNILAVLEVLVSGARDALAETPALLPVLKEAGVVDAGGAGLVTILEGALHFLKTSSVIEPNEPAQAAVSPEAAQTQLDPQQIRFGYCTEFIIDKKSDNVDVKAFSDMLDAKGDCKLVIDDDDIVKVHIHTNHPGSVLEAALKLGSLSRIKIDNMRLQHTTIIEQSTPAPAPLRPYGFVAVAAGEGLAKVFKDYGVDEIIEGGQTMNPSTEDILHAIERISARQIYILPNNKNIILAANQAAQLCSGNVTVIPTKTVPQGIAALMAFLPHLDEPENTAAMEAAISQVKTGQVTYAVRDTSVSGKQIKAGDVIGILDGEIATVGNDAQTVAFSLIGEMVDEDSSVITLYYGADTTEQQAASLASQIEEAYPDCDVMLQDGSQPLYYYILSVE